MNSSGRNLSSETNQSTNGSGFPFIPYLDIELPIVFVFKILVDIIGSLANSCLLIVCYLKHQTDPNGVNLIIFQLVTCWLLLDLIVFPINDVMTFLYRFGYHAPHAYCVFNMTATSVLMGMANWTEVCLAINRVMAICVPLHYNRCSSRKVIFCMLLTVWIVVSVFALMNFILKCPF